MNYNTLLPEFDHIHQLEASIQSYRNALQSQEKANSNADFQRRVFEHQLYKAEYIEQQLKEQTEQFSFLFDEHKLLVGIINDDGKTEYASWAKVVYKVQNGDTWKG